MERINKKTTESVQIFEMIYDYENETHMAVHLVISRVCHICHIFRVELTQSYQLTESRFQGSEKYSASRALSVPAIPLCTLTRGQQTFDQ
jgi:hypothetical protein